MKVTIRKTIASDHTAIIDLFNKCYNKNILYHDFNSAHDNIIIVAEIDDSIIGLLEISFIENKIQNTKYALLNNVCVEENYKRYGIESLLVKSAEDICREHECSFINLTSNKSKIEAHNLYYKEGYHETNTCILKKDLTN